MRFEVIAAYIMGVLLPTLEVIRRRTNFDDIPAYIDDFLVGGFLLYAARAVTQQRPNGRVLLVAAWSILGGGLYGSFFGQLQRSSDVSGFSNTLVILVKGVLYVVTIASLFAAVRSATPKTND